MHIRYLKIMFAVSTGLMVLFYVLQNFANIDAALQTIIYVMGGQDHVAYPQSMFFKSTNGTIAMIVLCAICLGELAAALFLLFGSVKMWQCRQGDSSEFRSATKYAEIGAGLGVLVWLGFFGAFGAAFFQMWQTQIGDASMDGAFQYFITCAITLFFLNLAKDS